MGCSAGAHCTPRAREGEELLRSLSGSAGRGEAWLVRRRPRSLSRSLSLSRRRVCYYRGVAHPRTDVRARQPAGPRLIPGR